MKSAVMVAGVVFLFLNGAVRAMGDVVVTVTNHLPIARVSETVEVKWSEVAAGLGKVRADHVIVTGEDGKQVVAQPIWVGGVKRKGADELVFQADFAGGECKRFRLAAGVPGAYEPRVYGRWVPERLDDFAWENDRIAFRVYGPALSAADPASSGVDVWPKRTRGLIVNKWYQLAQSISDGYYHIDHGEGLDNYKVGHGQGCGGTAILLDVKRLTTGTGGWTKQRVIANGPIRLIFELTYDPIDVGGVGVRETKRVILDAGQNLNHYQSTFVADKPIESLRIMSGIGEHSDRSYEKDFHKEQGWMSYWDAGDGPGESRPAPNSAPTGHVGTAVVMGAGRVEDAFEMDGQMELVTKAKADEPVDFWAGAGWDRSGDFKNYEDWKAYVADWAKRVGSPVEVRVAE